MVFSRSILVSIAGYTNWKDFNNIFTTKKFCVHNWRIQYRPLNHRSNYTPSFFMVDVSVSDFVVKVCVIILKLHNSNFWITMWVVCLREKIWNLKSWSDSHNSLEFRHEKENENEWVNHTRSEKKQEKPVVLTCT